MRTGKRNTLPALVCPALTMTLAMAQFAPAYEVGFPASIVETLIRAAVAFLLILWASRDLTTTWKVHPSPYSRSRQRDHRTTRKLRVSPRDASV